MIPSVRVRLAAAAGRRRALIRVIALGAWTSGWLAAVPGGLGRRPPAEDPVPIGPGRLWPGPGVA
jgi:hypothetical protein